ncbi:type II toxin-antitoxin system HicB family antitoxin [Candidatus Roizmanbacteria bacterium]|nr:type II toxin-antitoxin system HicB family antitoxin [Candidatus Roizmanbacteria bacterium]
MNDKKTIKLQEYELPITISPEKESGFVAVCSTWKDCYAQGETIEEAINEISYVASTLIELYKEENMEIPLKAKEPTEKENKSFTITFPLITSQV